jgi:hypothetical protein
MLCYDDRKQRRGKIPSVPEFVPLARLCYNHPVDRRDRSKEVT